MIKVENIETWGFKHAVRGMRNPLNSWDRSDSYENYTIDYKKDEYDNVTEVQHPYYRIGAADLDLMQRLYKAGTEHRKFLRQIFVSLDITAPLYWWKEFDTYKVGTVANSCSTMHKIAAKEFELDDFSTDYLLPDSKEALQALLDVMNHYRRLYLDRSHMDPKLNWWQLIQLLPTSYNQKRTITMNYENAVSMIKQRTGHKLDEWNEFVEQLKMLPYLTAITGIERNESE